MLDFITFIVVIYLIKEKFKEWFKPDNVKGENNHGIKESKREKGKSNF